MPTQHTCYPPLVVNSNGDVIRNVQTIQDPWQSETGDFDKTNMSSHIVFGPEPSEETCRANDFNGSENIVFEPEPSFLSYYADTDYSFKYFSGGGSFRLRTQSQKRYGKFEKQDSAGKTGRSEIL